MPRKDDKQIIVGLDIGLWYKGLCTDMAVTVPVGRVSEEATKLMVVTREACLAGANAIRVGGLISDVATAVEAVVDPHGYGIVRALVGHGVGRGLRQRQGRQGPGRAGQVARRRPGHLPVVKAGIQGLRARAQR